MKIEDLTTGILLQLFLNWRKLTFYKIPLKKDNSNSWVLAYIKKGKKKTDLFDNFC